MNISYMAGPTVIHDTRTTWTTQFIVKTEPYQINNAQQKIKWKRLLEEEAHYRIRVVERCHGHAYRRSEVKIKHDKVNRIYYVIVKFQYQELFPLPIEEPFSKVVE